MTLSCMLICGCANNKDIHQNCTVPTGAGSMCADMPEFFLDTPKAQYFTAEKTNSEKSIIQVISTHVM